MFIAESSEPPSAGWSVHGAVAWRSRSHPGRGQQVSAGRSTKPLSGPIAAL